jgi:diguanylate cyclase (GGDEF)-like protein
MEKPFALIVEDERDIAALFRHMLDMSGYQTEIVLDGGEAMKRLDSAKPDILLLDLYLPTVSGVQILQRMHSDPRLTNVPVVVITANPQAVGGLPIEPDLVLLKPVNLSQLSSLVQRLTATPTLVQDSPWDEVTHLYNRSFFTLRLAYSLERAGQMGSDRFGILFIDLDSLETLQENGDGDQMNAFLREAGAHFKTILRPTDTLSRFDEGLFLVLVENVAGRDVPAKVTVRVRKQVEEFLGQKKAAGVQVHVGLLICDAAYASAGRILDDLELARSLARQDGASIVYDQDYLKSRRNSGAGA